MNEFTDKVALITGAGRGIGREIVVALASLGTAVAVNDINPINLDETVSQIMRAGGKVRPYVFDIAKRMPVEGMVSQVLADFGRIDIRMRDNIPLVIDVNSNPDITAGSSFITAAEFGGYDYSATLDRIVRLAIARAGQTVAKCDRWSSAQR